MFELKKETVEIKKKDGTADVYEISPISGKYLSDLYAVMDAFQAAQKSEETEKEMLKILSTDISSKLHKVVFASLEQNYPDVDKKQLDAFVSSNLLKFIEAVVRVNMPES